MKKKISKGKIIQMLRGTHIARTKQEQETINLINSNIKLLADATDQLMKVMKKYPQTYHHIDVIELGRIFRNARILSDDFNQEHGRLQG